MEVEVDPPPPPPAVLLLCKELVITLQKKRQVCKKQILAPDVIAFFCGTEQKKHVSKTASYAFFQMLYLLLLPAHALPCGPQGKQGKA